MKNNIIYNNTNPESHENNKQDIYSAAFNIYDKLDLDKYDNRIDSAPREKYLGDHWDPMRIGVIKKYCAGKKVLDLGCGSGFYTSQIKEVANKVIGVDASKNMLDRARKNYSNIDFTLADAHKIPFGDKSFDVVSCIGLFEYIRKDIVLKEIFRVLGDNGELVLSVTNRNGFSRLIVNFVHKLLKKENFRREPSYREMVNLFKNNGFNIIETKMDDGLILLPNFLDKLIGIKVYKFIEKLFKPFGRNPFSTNMLFVVQK